MLLKKENNNSNLNSRALVRIDGRLVVMFAELWAFVKVTREEDPSDETVEDARKKQWNQIEDHDIREIVTLEF